MVMIGCILIGVHARQKTHAVDLCIRISCLHLAEHDCISLANGSRNFCGSIHAIRNTQRQIAETGIDTAYTSALTANI